MSNKSFALAAFNTAVIATNAAHAAKRGVVAGTTATKEAGVAFWAGMKYAHNYNKANAAAAERLTPEDIAASKPKSAKTRTVSKRSAKRSAE